MKIFSLKRKSDSRTMVILASAGIAPIILFLTGFVYIARYEVCICTKEMFRVKMPQGQIIAGVS